jgi:hypothetical protein
VPGGKAHPAPEPLEHVGLELHERRRRLPHAGVAVRRVGDEVGQRRGEQAAARDEGQVARAGRVEGASHPLLEERREQRLELGAVLGRPGAQRAAQLLRGGVAAGRLAIEAGQVLHDALQHLLAERAHALGRQLERREIDRRRRAVHARAAHWGSAARKAFATAACCAGVSGKVATP